MTEKKKLNVKILTIEIILGLSLSILFGYFIFVYQNAMSQTVKLTPAQTLSYTIQGNTYYLTYIYYDGDYYETGRYYFAVTTPQNPTIHTEVIQTETGQQLHGDSLYIAQVGKQYKISLYSNHAINVTVSEVNSDYLVLHVAPNTP
jgi:hypothetical protein